MCGDRSQIRYTDSTTDVRRRERLLCAGRAALLPSKVSEQRLLEPGSESVNEN